MVYTPLYFFVLTCPDVQNSKESAKSWPQNQYVLVCTGTYMFYCHLLTLYGFSPFERVCTMSLQLILVSMSIYELGPVASTVFPVDFRKQKHKPGY